MDPIVKNPLRLLVLWLLMIAAVSCGQREEPVVSPTLFPPAGDTVPAPSEELPPAPTETPPAVSGSFDKQRAFGYLEAQMAFGPRWPGSEGHQQVIAYIVDQLNANGWDVELQPFDYQGFAARNIIARANVGVGPIVMLGAHFDTRRLADQTPGAAEAMIPVPGAVDGASGVAVLLELSRSLDLEQVPRELWLAFFDVEDNGSGGIPGWSYIAGSTYMAANLDQIPQSMVLVDMIGDADQQIYYEGNSDPALREELWRIAADLGYNDSFIPSVKYTMIDDHLPFARLGVAAVDLIDFDYPYWHTVDDTTDKASPDSLGSVGDTIESWLEHHLE